MTMELFCIHGSFMAVFILSLYILHVTDAASVSLSCPQIGCHGHSYNMTLEITGNITSGIKWLNPADEEVVICVEDEPCQVLPGYKLVVETPTKHVLEVTKFSAKDSGKWICQDGFEEPAYCENTDLAAPGLSHLSLTCNRDQENFEVSCTGLQGHGSPPAELTLTGIDTEERTSTEMMLIVRRTKLNGEVFTCSVSGRSNECLPPDVATTVTTSCPGPSCISVNTYMIVFELILIIAGLFNLLVLYLGSTDVGEEEMVDKGVLWLLGIVLGVLLLLLGTVHAILLAQFCEVVTSLPIAGSVMCAVSLLIGLGLLIISVLKKVLLRRHSYSVPEDLKRRQGGNTTNVEEDTDELEEDTEK